MSIIQTTLIVVQDRIQQIVLDEYHGISSSICGFFPYFNSIFYCIRKDIDAPGFHSQSYIFYYYYHTFDCMKMTTRALLKSSNQEFNWKSTTRGNQIGKIPENCFNFHSSKVISISGHNLGVANNTFC